VNKAGVGNTRTNLTHSEPKSCINRHSLTCILTFFLEELLSKKPYCALMKKFPLGIQNFPRIRDENFLYIDKTALIYKLVTEGVAYFFSRPRRFGKSLLISTLNELFQGNRLLFSGLWIDSSDYEWRQYSVIRLDFSKTVSSTPEALTTSLQELLKEIARAYGVSDIEKPFPSLTLSALVAELAKKGPVVILIDEYDKPLVHHLKNMELVDKNRDILRDFFMTIKALDQYLHFVFITGVSKFSKVSLFSGMNNLRDISLNDTFTTLLGLTDEEITTNLQEAITSVAHRRKEHEAQVLSDIKFWYNGYRFSSSESTLKVYNPFSLFSYFDTSKLDNYWFSTATPSFVIELIKNRQSSILDFENGIIAGKEIEVSHEVDELDIPTLLYQTGYLTIDRYEEKSQTYFLRFPNEEVRHSFLEHLLHAFSELQPSEVQKVIYSLSKCLIEHDLTSFFKTFNAFLSAIPYQIHKEAEGYYHSLLYLFLRTLGFKVSAEVSTNKGRIDMVLQTNDTSFIFEFKINASAQEALEQILANEYYKQYTPTKKHVILVGVNFDTALRTIDEWKMHKVFLS
jgi:hypothetical protein